MMFEHAPRHSLLFLALVSLSGCQLFTPASVSDGEVCQEHEHVVDGSCVPCAPGSTRSAGDDPSSVDSTMCDVTTCAQDEYVESNACKPCPMGASRAAGDLATGEDTRCDQALCGEDEYVFDNQCVPCPTAQTNEAGDPTAGANTSCEPIYCQANERVFRNECIPCEPGLTSEGNDPATGSNTECEPLLCQENEYVSSNTCIPCAPGSTRPAGDDASGSDTQCGPTICNDNERVVSNTCVPCEPGSISDSGADATGEDTQCEVIECGEDEYVQNHDCVECQTGSTNDSGDLATGDGTSCAAIICEEDTFVQDFECVPCRDGTTNEAGDETTEGNTDCDPVICVADEYVEDNACQPCAAGTANDAGDDASQGNTSCEAILCGVDEYVSSNTCLACPMGLSNPPGDDASGADTMCDLGACTSYPGALCVETKFELEPSLSSSLNTKYNMGDAVAMNDSALFVGVPRGNRAYMYLERSQGWQREQIIQSTDSRPVAFGDNIVASASHLAISDSQRERNSDDCCMGYVYFYNAVGNISTTSWVSSGSASPGGDEDTENGKDLALVGTSRVYASSSKSLSSLMIFNGGTPGGAVDAPPNTNGDDFGDAIAANNDYVVASQRTQTADNILILDANMNLATITTFGVPSGDRFGCDIELTANNDLFISACRGDLQGIQDQGLVYHYKLTSPATWTLQNTIAAPTPMTNANFGYAIDVDDTGNFLVVGAPGMPNDMTSTNAGTVYVYELQPTGAPVLITQITPTDSSAETSFGAAVAIHGERILVGAPGTPTSGFFPITNHGSAYLYELDLVP